MSFDELDLVRTGVGRAFAMKGSRKSDAFFGRKPFIVLMKSAMAMCAISIRDGFVGDRVGDELVN
jgi:hypothetical protein